MSFYPSNGQNFPQFLGLGVQKGGTTTLQKLLEQHPQVWLSPQKELQFFSLQYDRGSEWYAGCFAQAQPHQICGDITPYYIFHPQAAKRIASLIPAARLIVLLRDPVERCLSQYFHSCRLGLESLDLEAALAAEPVRLAGSEDQLLAANGRHRGHQEHSYVARSRYEDQLNCYWQYFDHQQLILIKSEEFFERCDDVWLRIQQFLGLEPIPLPQMCSPANVGDGEAASVPKEIRALLRQQLDSTYRVMEDRYGISW